MTIVYRSKCFESQEALNSYNRRNPAAATVKPPADEIDTSTNLKLEEILDVLKQDLVSKNLLSQKDSDSISKVDLGTLLLDTYIKYPLPPYGTAAIPYNYCALPRNMKSFKSVLEKLLTPFCGSFNNQEGSEDL